MVGIFFTPILFCTKMFEFFRPILFYTKIFAFLNQFYFTLKFLHFVHQFYFTPKFLHFLHHFFLHFYYTNFLTKKISFFTPNFGRNGVKIISEKSTKIPILNNISTLRKISVIGKITIFPILMKNLNFHQRNFDIFFLKLMKQFSNNFHTRLNLT